MKQLIYFTHFILIGFLLVSCNKEKTDKSIRDLLFGEANPNYSAGADYDYFTEDKRELFFSDEFDNNNHNWPLDFFSNYNYRKIQNGKYYLSKYINSGTQFTNSTTKVFGNDMDTSRNFELELRFNAEIDDEATPKYYLFSFHSNAGTSKLEVYGQQDKIKLNGTESAVMHTYTNVNQGYDVITIRKVDHFFYLFVNESFVYSCKSSGVSTKVFDFQTSKYAEIDYIKMDYLIL